MESFTTTLDFGLRSTVPPRTDEVKSSGRRSIGARSRNYRPCTICKRRKTKCEMIEGQGMCKFCLRKGIECVVKDIHERTPSPSETETSGTDVHPPHPDNTDAHDDQTFSTLSPQDIGYAYVLSTAIYPVHLGQVLPIQEPSAAQTYCETQDDMLGQAILDVIHYAHCFGENGCDQHHAAVDSVIVSQTFLETEPGSFGLTTIPSSFDDLMDEEIAHHSAVQQQFSLDNPQDSRTPHTSDSSTIYEAMPVSTCPKSRPEVENEYTGAYSPVSSDGSTSSSQESPPSTPIGPTYPSDRDWVMYLSSDNEYMYIANIEFKFMNGQLVLTPNESCALFRRAVLLVSHLGDYIGYMSHFVHSEGDKFFYGRRDYDLKGDPIEDALYLSRVNGELSGALFRVHGDRSLMGSTVDAVVDMQYPACLTEGLGLH